MVRDSSREVKGDASSVSTRAWESENAKVEERQARARKLAVGSQVHPTKRYVILIRSPP